MCIRDSLISGRETLEDVNMIVYCGGFSNSDVLGSAKGGRVGGLTLIYAAFSGHDLTYARYPQEKITVG